MCHGTPNRLAFLFSLALLAATAFAGTSQQSNQIRHFLEGLDASDAPVVAGQTLNEPLLVADVYRQRNHAPLWLAGAPLAGEADNLVIAIAQSADHGFSTRRYHLPEIDRLMGAKDDASRLALELLMTDAFLSQALHRGRGAVYLPDLDTNWHVAKAEVDPVALLLKLARQPAPVFEVLDVLWPPGREYAKLLERRAEISASGDETTEQVPPGPLLKPGQSGDRILLLKERLMGPGEYTDIYDSDLRREVLAFQRTAGLETDGIVGDNTLEVLNATKVSWIERIDANLERWRWLPRETPATYLRVNIAAYTLRVIEDGQQPLAMNVIVGKPYRHTPVFTEKLKYMVLNPYWNVPFSIATKDKLPLLKTDAATEAAKGFEAKPHGGDEFVPVDAVDWSSVTPRTFTYLLRQRPSELNALGRIKFMLPNAFAVYLHDTPSGNLFSLQERAFSSGCVRLERPVELASWLLSRENHPEASGVESLIGGGVTQTIYLKQPVPTYIVYFTAFVGEEGEIVFRRDVYGRDRPIISALRGNGS